MRIALDYDGTYTRDPAAWDTMIDAFKASGHDVICITSRPRSVLAIPEIPVRVYYADCQPKLEFANENGLAVDVWVDDMPWCIGGPQT